MPRPENVPWPFTKLQPDNEKIDQILIFGSLTVEMLS
jgi:hypothetical protein